MAKAKGDFLFGLDTATAVLKAVSDGLKARGLDEDELRNVLRDENTLRAVVSAFAQDDCNAYPLAVDCSLSGEQVLKDCGVGNLCGGGLLKVFNWPALRSCIVSQDYYLIGRHCCTTPQAGHRMLSSMGLRAADVRELVAFASAYPHEAHNAPILALNSRYKLMPETRPPEEQSVAAFGWWDEREISSIYPESMSLGSFGPRSTRLLATHR